MRKFLEILPLIILIGLVVVIVVGAIWAGNKNQVLYDACVKKCDIVRSKVMEGECYCATKTGWELAK